MTEHDQTTEPADRSILGELRELISARWELARLEITADLRSIVFLAVVWLIAALVIFTSLPLVVVALADALDGCFGMAQGVWLLIFAVVLLLSAVLGGYCAWRRFRRTFSGLSETIEELREDMEWIKEIKP